MEPLEEEVSFCEPKNVIFFDEEGKDGKKRQDKDLVSYLTSLEKHEDWIAKTSNENMRSYVFNSDTCRNVEWQDEMLKANVYQREDLKTEISSKAKRSNCFNAHDYCVFTDGLNKGDEQLAKTVEDMKEDRKISFQDTVEGQSKNLEAKEKEQLVITAGTEKDNMFLISIEEEQNFYSFKEDGECHKAKYDEYESDEDKYETVQQIKLIDLVLDKRRVSSGEEFGDEVSIQSLDFVRKQREAKIESRMHLVNVYSEIEEEGQSIKIVVAEVNHEDDQLLRVVSQGQARANTSLQLHVVLASIQRIVSKYVAASRDLEGNLLSNNEFVDNSKSFVTLTQERVQQQQQSSLDNEIESLMEFLLKKYKRRSYIRRRQIVSCMDGWTEAKVKGNLNGVLQTKVWKLGATKEDNQMYEQQYKEERRSL